MRELGLLFRILLNPSEEPPLFERAGRHFQSNHTRGSAYSFPTRKQENRQLYTRSYSTDLRKSKVYSRRRRII